eukprot:CAMPEP_0170758168 /NCGR_PEP_ID=MMETSP0733-20121128/159_1 /TAXON_ID=186038 /ORGANISM="Fragilariopsis kerguelensis, Strain L26-C5" /LENGTH=434 /DNA_ID=CAMNT_0011097397 /DNA_START=448 /DNA_END=1752 /DNA_ORIENTATION=+
MSDDMFPLVQLSEMADDKEESTNTNADDAQKEDKADDTKDDDQSDDSKDGDQDGDDDADDDMDWLSGPPADAPEMEIIECDVAIIGGGPAGATCALYTSRADLSTVILDKNEAIGALAITSHIANYPGVDRAMTGIELLQQMKTQAIDYGTRICDRAQVFMIDIPTEDEACSDAHRLYNKIVYTPDYTVKARSLVLATGAMGRSMPYLPGEEKYLGQGVSYCATCDGAFYRNSEVAVFGATNEALEEAMFLTKFASTVHWITPIDVTGYIERLEAHKLGDENNPEFNHMFDEEQLQHFLSLDNVKHHNKARLREVQGDMSGVTGVRIRHQGDKKEQDVIIPSEGAFIYGAGGGSKPITDFLSEGSGITLDDGGGVVVNDDMESISKKGIFAIGDIRNTPYKQVVVAAADGCVAAMSIEKFLKNRKTIKLDWIHK